MEVAEPDQVWCVDITYLPMEKAHAYLIGIMDWKTRAVFSWEVSDTVETSSCVRALEAAMQRIER